MDDKVYDEPSEARAVRGLVSVEGPDGLSVLLTPDAATETSDRLLDAAVTAQGQRVTETRKPDAKGGSDRSEPRSSLIK